jgi:FkbM family methyltransferase
MASNPGLLEYIQSRNIDVEFLIEAGCHDGTDTLKFVSDRRFKKIYAFEPDSEAFELARLRLANFLDIVTLKSVVLMDQAREVIAHPLDGNFGTGSTIFNSFLESSDQDTSRVMFAMPMDEVIPRDLSGKGALWLDVEGAGLLVLRGSRRILRQIAIAQIEVEMHNQSTKRLKNYLGIVRLMKDNDFYLVGAPLHPGYFGDVLFLSKGEVGFFIRLKSYCLQVLFITLHAFIYPMLRKPRNFLDS